MKHIKLLLLAVFFILSFRILQFFPGLIWLRESWIIIAFIFLVDVLIIRRWNLYGFKYTRYELYILVLNIFPLYAAILAYIVFGQPLIYGILTQRNIVLTTTAVMLYYFVKNCSISLEEIKHILVTLGWISLIGYTSLILFVNPGNYANYNGFVIGNPVKGYEFKLNYTFITFSLLYYFVSGIMRHNYLYYFLAIPFFLYLILVAGGRALLVSLGIAMLITAFQIMPIKKFIAWSTKLLIISASFILFLFLVTPDFLVTLAGRYKDAFTVILTGNQVKDISANVRITETLTAWPFIKSNWLFGNGSLSHHWQDGYGAKLGYFYPSDIGLLGVVFMYGIVGLFIFSIQFYFARNYLRMIPTHLRSPFIVASKTFLVYIAINSIVTGKFVHYSSVSLIFVSILCLGASSYLPDYSSAYYFPYIERG